MMRPMWLVMIIYILDTVFADTMNGQYCKSVYSALLEYQAGFHCEHYCCGDDTYRFCCKNKRYMVPNGRQSPILINVEWTDTLYTKISCTVIVLLLATITGLVVCFICCRTDHGDSRPGSPVRRHSLAWSIGSAVLNRGAERTRTFSVCTNRRSSLPQKVLVTVTDTEGHTISRKASFDSCCSNNPSRKNSAVLQMSHKGGLVWKQQNFTENGPSNL